ncbi:MAG TPA: hypothetical protein VME20_09730, partial [Acidimicrobiales bacterium]|nr:hypothetical protein [Acidimicrobiales bacterium]
WPAAQPTPPSLAGAYSTNMMKVLVTLITYEDWVWSHPNPALVANYMLPGGNAYEGELDSVTHLAHNGWHTDPSPTEIDWLAITVAPKQLLLINHKRAIINKRPAYTPATLTVVINQKPSSFMNRSGVVVARSSGKIGKIAFSETLSQGSDAQWRIFDVYRLNPLHGLGSLRK